MTAESFTASHKKEIELALERQHVAERHVAQLSKSNKALQATIDALSEIKDPDLIVPTVLKIASETFLSKSCAFFLNNPDGNVSLQYWCSDGKIFMPDEMLALDPDKFAIVRMLAQGFTVPDSYLGGPGIYVNGPVLLDHVKGTSVKEFDDFAVSAGWEQELNIGVASKGLRAFTLCIYREADKPFSEAEIALGDLLAKQLGLAMETCRLVKETKESAVLRERETAAQARVAELSEAILIMSRLSSTLTQDFNLSVFLSRMLQEIYDLFRADASIIFVRDDDADELVMAAHIMKGKQSDRPVRVPMRTAQVFLNALMESELVREFDVETETHLLMQTSVPYHKAAGHTRIFALPILLRGEPIGFIGVAMKRRGKLVVQQQELLVALARKAAMAIHLTRQASIARDSAVIEERNRMAREIHDTLAQGFTAMLVNLKTLRRESSRLSPQAQDTIATLETLAQENLIEARRSVRQLRPGALQHGNLTHCLRQFVTAERPGANIILEIDTDIPEAGEEVESELLRIAQEAVRNAIRYSERVNVTLVLHRFDNAGIYLEIRDDGMGFDLASTKPGYGMIGMRERAARIGASLTIISEEGYGARVIVTWTS